MSQATVRAVFDRWVEQVDSLFEEIATTAASAGWQAEKSSREIEESAPGVGVPYRYTAPVLILARGGRIRGDEQRITFEPRYRFPMGAAGRIDVYSVPSMREALLFRLPDATRLGELTLEEAEERVLQAPWGVFTTEKVPLNVDLKQSESLLDFLNALADPRD